MDVVEAKAADWVRDPFTAVVENGYVYGRGASDMKLDVTMLVSTLVRLKAEGFKPSRDIILALSGDEETDMLTSQALAKQLAGAEFALNADAGGGVLDEANKPVVYALQAGEKTYADFDITITNPGGHSSRPNKTNAIYDLAKMIDKIGAYQFAPQANELTRAYLKASGLKTPGELGQAMLRYAADPTDKAASDRLSAEPEYIGQVRTTCVATMLRGGHALNALPQAATVSVNCRIMPGVAIAPPNTKRNSSTNMIGCTLEKNNDSGMRRFAMRLRSVTTIASPIVRRRRERFICGAASGSTDAVMTHPPR
jgi:acetylornithine deacetylase/succinyl-diaminopimelate desuccinylase-like protein